MSDFLADIASGNFGEVPKQKAPKTSFCVKASKHISTDKKVTKATKKAEITMKPIMGFAKVKKITANKYLIYSSANTPTLKRIVNTLTAFNDMEIAYSDTLEGNDLIRKSKKPLWVISKSTSGEFVLERCV